MLLIIVTTILEIFHKFKMSLVSLILLTDKRQVQCVFHFVSERLIGCERELITCMTITFLLNILLSDNKDVSTFHGPLNR